MKLTLFILTMALAWLPMKGEGVASWLNSVHDFGTFKEESGNVTCEMKMVNTGNSELRITNVRPTCGCTASQYTVNAIAPGDTAMVILTYNPANRPGRFEKDVYVYTDGKPEKSTLTIKGNVIGAPATIMAQYPESAGHLKLDRRIIPFGAITKGKSRTQFIAVYNQGEDTMSAVFGKVPDHLKVEMIPSNIPAGEQATITVTYRSADCNEWGLAQDQFVMETFPVNATENAVLGVAKIDITAVLKENFSRLTDEQRMNAPIAKLSTDKVDFGKIDADAEAVKGELVITNTGKSKLMIRRIYTLDEGVALCCKKSEIKPGKTAKIEITITPSALEKILNAKATVITNDPETPVQEVRLVGQIIKTN